MGFIPHTQIDEFAGQVGGSPRRFNNEVLPRFAGDTGGLGPCGDVDPVAHGSFHCPPPRFGNRPVPGRPGRYGNGEDVNAFLRLRG